MCVWLGWCTERLHSRLRVREPPPHCAWNSGRERKALHIARSVCGVSGVGWACVRTYDGLPAPRALGGQLCEIVLDAHALLCKHWPLVLYVVLAKALLSGCGRSSLTLQAQFGVVVTPWLALSGVGTRLDSQGRRVGEGSVMLLRRSS